ncbi:hypothetical protein TcBrA4_0033170 [Trypanosoma cruzi]|nr:hypothetical protein TcBrA4_0033170 [Trypanosoma cruzi]
MARGRGGDDCELASVASPEEDAAGPLLRAHARPCECGVESTDRREKEAPTRATGIRGGGCLLGGRSAVAPCVVRDAAGPIREKCAPLLAATVCAGVLGGGTICLWTTPWLARVLAEGIVGGGCQQELCALAMPATSSWCQGRLTCIIRGSQEPAMSPSWDCCCRRGADGIDQRPDQPRTTGAHSCKRHEV